MKKAYVIHIVHDYSMDAIARVYCKEEKNEIVKRYENKGYTIRVSRD